MRCHEPLELDSSWRGPGRRLLAIVLLLGAAGLACTPSIANDPVPDEMEFDTEVSPQRVPEPSGLIVNPTTGHLDFSLAGTPVPADCTQAGAMPEAQCEFSTYLQSLDGYPTSAHARAPTTAAAIVPSTLTVGENVVVVDASGAPVTGIQAAFDPVARYVTIAPDAQRRRWTVGASYWLAIRGYASGLRSEPADGTGSLAATAAGSEIVASPTQFLLKQEFDLTCGVSTPGALTTQCATFELLDQPPRTPAAAAAAVFQLEQIRAAYKALGAWDRIAAAGLPKEAVAILWGFPIHSGSVAELDPTAGIVPQVTGADEIHVGVQGSVDPATVTPFIVTKALGSVVVMDLTAAAAGDLLAGFPPVAASYVPTSVGGGDTVDGNIVIKATAPFVPGHQYGIFLLNTLHNAAAAPLVPAPVSKLLTLRGALVDAGGHSTVSAVGDTDAASLEVGRQALAALFNDPTFSALTGISRDSLVYCYAFPFPVMQ
jgi:hypothetical protein